VINRGGNYTGSLSNDKAYRFAADNNFEIVVPDDYELQIDLDSEEEYQYFLKQLKIVKRYMPIEGEPKIKPSRHGLPKRHATVRLTEKVSQIERICLQACLGSDRVRELLCYFRVKVCNEAIATLFFEPKERVSGQD